MKCLHQAITRAIFLGVLLLSSITSLAIDYGDIPKKLLPPAGWLEDKWTNPGGWTTIDVTKHGLIPGNQSINATAKVRDIINSTKSMGNRILYFPEGSYWFTSTLVITESGIRLKGAGASKSKLYQRNAEFIFRSSDSSDERINLSSPPSRGDTSLTSSNAGQLKKGDFILPLAQFPFGANGGSSNDKYRNEMSKEGRGQIVTVKSVSGNSIQISEPMGLNFASWPDQRIERLTMQKNVGIENVRIEKLVEDKKETLTMQRVTNGFVRNVRFKQTHKKTILTRLCYRIFIEGNNISDGWNKTKGGHAYGVQLNQNTTRAYVINNKLERLRHGIVLQQGANHCVVAYNHTVSNILLHGNYANNNLFEGNVIDKAINFDAVHGINGPYNFIYRNIAIDPSGGNKGIGYLKGAAPQVVIANVTGILQLDGDEYTGANREGTKNHWGSLSPSSQLPDSLYLISKPSFMGSKPWPIAGPDLGNNWGASNTNPAHDRAREDVPPYKDGPTSPEPVNQAPNANAGSDIFVTDSNGNGTETVTLNGSGSNDSDGSIASYKWFAGGSLLGSGKTLNVNFGVGTHTVTLTVVDNDGAKDSDKVVVTVKAPSVDPEPEPQPDPGNGDSKLVFSSPKDGDVIAEGSDLYVKVTAPNVSIKNMKLYLNGEFVRRESQAPYEWGKASQTDTVLANMAVGEYQLEALAVTVNGESISQSISIKVQPEGASEPVSVPSDIYSAGTFISSNNINKNGHVKANSWLGYNVDFGIGNNTVKFKASSGRNGGTIECRLGSQDGKVIGRVYVPPTGGWYNFIDIYCYVGDLPDSGKIFFTFDGGLKTLLDIEEFSFVSTNLMEKLEAEDAILSEAKVESSINGFSGSGYAVFKANSFAGWSPVISKAGKYTLTFNYSLLAENTELELLVNDKFVPSSLLFTNENNWGRFSVDVELEAGENTIILTNGSSVTLQVDAMTIRK